MFGNTAIDLVAGSFMFIGAGFVLLLFYRTLKELADRIAALLPPREPTP